MASHQKNDYWNWATICIGLFSFCTQTWDLIRSEQGGRLTFYWPKFGFVFYDDEAAIMYAGILFLSVALVTVGVRGLKHIGNDGA